MNKAENKGIAEHIKKIISTSWNSCFMVYEPDSLHISYRQFLNCIINGKGLFQKYNTNNSDAVAIIMNNSPDLAILYFAALVSKLKLIPIDPQKSKHEIEKILENADCDLLVSDKKDFNQNILKNKVHISADLVNKVLFEDRDIDKKHLNIFDSVDYSLPFVISYTSGSTGSPKGVVHSFSNLYKSAISFSECYEFSDANIFLHNLPMTYMAGILNLIIVPFISASKIIITERFSISSILNFWETPIEFGINTFFFIPAIVNLLLKMDRGEEGANYCRLSSIKACIGTAPLNAESKVKFEKKYSTELFESYGLTETLFLSANFPKNSKEGSVGKALNKVEIFLSPEMEILVKTPWNLYGYYKEKELNNIDGETFATGDMGSLDSDGYLSITGRIKDIIIRGGVNIAPVKIEKIIAASAFLNEFKVIGTKDTILGEKTVCFYLSDKDISQNMKKDINNILRSELNADHIIDEFQIIESMPRNINGKIDVNKIRNIYKV